MNGRLENQLKTEAKMEMKVRKQPEVIQEWYMNMCSSGRTDFKTTELYLGYVLRFFDYLRQKYNKPVQLSDIKVMDVNEFMSKLRFKHKGSQLVSTSNSYRATVWCGLNNFFSYMYANGKIGLNPMENITRASSSKDAARIKRVSLTPEELQKLVYAVMEGTGSQTARSKQKTWRTRDLAIILTLIYTGMRVTALTEINMSDVDFDMCTINVTDKRDKTYVCTLPPDVMAYLAEWKSKRYEFLDYDFLAEPFFISNQRKRITSRSVERIVGKYTKAIGKEVSPHKIRASYATNLYNETKDIYFVQQCMGHSNIETTKRYINESGNARKEGAEIMGSMLRLS